MWAWMCQAPVHPEDLEWGGAGQTPVHAAGAVEAGARPEATAVQHVNVAETEAAHMSDEAAAQWLEGAATTLPRLVPTLNGIAAGESLQVTGLACCSATHAGIPVAIKLPVLHSY